MSPLDALPEEIDELLDGFMSHSVFGNMTVGLTTYTFWLIVALALLLVVLFVFKKKQAESLVPQGTFVNGVEFVVQYIRDDVVKGICGETWKKHFPFLCTMFFFILANSIVGMIPGCHPGTGTIGVTAAIAVCSFVYFVVLGCKRMGVLGYIKSLSPKGVPCPINLLVACIECFSNFLRPITLAIRLFCNMFAGHIVMGVFAILASLFVEPLLNGFSVIALGNASASIFWVALLIGIYVVEILVGVIQAYVFTLLSAVYIQQVEQEH